MAKAAFIEMADIHGHGKKTKSTHFSFGSVSMDRVLRVVSDGLIRVDFGRVIPALFLVIQATNSTAEIVEA